MLQDQIREKDVLDLGLSAEVHLDGTTISFVNDAVGDDDVFRIAAPEAEDGPARTECAVGDGHIFATTEEGAGVVLGLHVAIADVNVLATDEVEAVVVAIDAVVDAKALHPDEITLDDSNGVEGAGNEKNIANTKILAAIEEKMIRTLAAASSRRRRNAAAGAAKLCALAVNGSRTFNVDIFGIDGEDQADIAVAESGVTSEGNGIGGAVLLAVGAAEESGLRRDVQGDVALQLDRADYEDTRGDEHRSSLFLVARIYGRLERCRIQGLGVTFGPKIADVVDARTESVVRGGRRSVRTRGRSDGRGQTRTNGGRGQES